MRTNHLIRLVGIVLYLFVAGLDSSPFILTGSASGEYTSYSAPDTSRFVGAAAYPDGRFVGFAECRTGAGNVDFGMIGFNQAGTLTTAVAAGGAGSDRVTCGSIMLSGDVISGGITNSFALPYMSQILIRLSDAGMVQSARTMVFDGESAIRGLAPAADGGFVTCGWTMVPPMMILKDATVSRFSESGVLQWCTIFDDGYFSLWLTGIAPTSDGGCIVSGTMGSTGMENLVVFKLAGDGSLDWHRHMGAPFYMDGIFIQETGGSYMIASTILDVPTAFLFMKMTATGDLEWAYRYNLPDGAIWLESMAMSADGTFIGTGSSYLDDPDTDQCLVFRLSSGGAVEWGCRVGEPGDDEINAGTGIAALPENQIGVSGYRQRSSPLAIDMLVIRLESDGTIPYCDTVFPVAFTVTDVTSDLTPFTRDVTVTSSSPAVTDVTSLIMQQNLMLTQTVFCNGLNVPAASRVGWVIILMSIGCLIARKK
ncbi:hypothetical protein JXA80_04725 [bacterium]|nr:hypothetical protein [candidate division CSSED10-310 bacterium]